MAAPVSVLWVALNGVVVDPTSGRRYVAKEVAEGYAGREELIPGIHAKYDALADALEGCRVLLASSRFDVRFVAAVPVANPSAAAGTIDWVARHLGAAAAGRVVLASDWSVLRGDVLLATEARGFAGHWLRFTGWADALARLLA